MKILSKDEFYALKASDTAVIYGCGFSINKLTQEEQKKLELYDSFGFN